MNVDNIAIYCLTKIFSYVAFHTLVRSPSLSPHLVMIQKYRFTRHLMIIIKGTSIIDSIT
jgi:hypothetical protein